MAAGAGEAWWGTRTVARGKREAEAPTGRSPAGQQATSRTLFPRSAESQPETTRAQARYRLRSALPQNDSAASRSSDRRAAARAMWLRRRSESRKNRAAVSTRGGAEDHLETL